MKPKRIVDDRITFRADPDQVRRLRELEAQSKDLKMSAVVRAALRHYFTCEDSRLPNGELLNPQVPLETVIPKQIAGLPNKTGEDSLTRNARLLALGIGEKNLKAAKKAASSKKSMPHDSRMVTSRPAYVSRIGGRAGHGQFEDAPPK